MQIMRRVISSIILVSSVSANNTGKQTVFNAPEKEEANYDDQRLLRGGRVLMANPHPPTALTMLVAANKTCMMWMETSGPCVHLPMVLLVKNGHFYEENVARVKLLPLSRTARRIMASTRANTLIQQTLTVPFKDSTTLVNTRMAVFVLRRTITRVNVKQIKSIRSVTMLPPTNLYHVYKLTFLILHRLPLQPATNHSVAWSRHS
jgi:hypothetical protein